MTNKKLLILVIGMFFLIGALAPTISAKNFNITSNGNDLSQGDDLVEEGPFYVNGTSGNSWFGYNVGAVGDFCIEGGNCLNSKFYKLNNVYSIEMFPSDPKGSLDVFSFFIGGILYGI